MEKKLKQIKQEEREKTHTSKLEIKYGNKHLKRLAEECGYEFVYRAWLNEQRQAVIDLACAFASFAISIIAFAFSISGVGDFFYLIFCIMAYYFLSSSRIDSIRVDQYFDKIVNASRTHGLQAEIEASSI